MTAENNIPNEDQPETDPIGPITLPPRSRLGARAMALVGTVSVAALGVAAVTDGCSTWPTIES